MKIIDYASLIPGSKRTTAEDRERAKKVFAELSTIAKERNIVFVTAKHRSGPPSSAKLEWFSPLVEVP